MKAFSVTFAALGVALAAMKVAGAPVVVSPAGVARVFNMERGNLDEDFTVNPDPIHPYRKVSHLASYQGIRTETSTSLLQRGDPDEDPTVSPDLFHHYQKVTAVSYPVSECIQIFTPKLQREDLDVIFKPDPVGPNPYRKVRSLIL
jgi:hypothetical protein